MGFWEWLAERPDERATFDMAMEHGLGRRVDRLRLYPWRGDETVVDVGGGNGSLLLALLERRPGLRGIVFDRPETNVHDLGDRCSVRRRQLLRRGAARRTCSSCRP